MACAFTAVLFALMLAFTLESEPAHAATFATNNSGKTSYFCASNRIYRFNAKTGKAKKIRTFKNTFNVSDVRCYRGYPYFTLNKYAGTAYTENYIYRMKTNGKKLKKLATGRSPFIRSGKIYYTAQRRTTADASYVTVNKGAAVMTTAGKKKKTLVKMADGAKMVLSNSKLYIQHSDNRNPVYEYSLKGKRLRTIMIYSTSGASPMLEASDNKYLYFVDYYHNEVRVLTAGKTKTSRIWKIPSFDIKTSQDYTFCGAAGGYAFKSRSKYSSTTYSGSVLWMRKPYSNKTYKIKGMPKMKPVRVLAKNGKWLIIEFAKVGRNGNNTYVSRITTSGKKYKALASYFKS